jgi:muramoyltetrapeptide carboxypeptidase
MSTQLLPQLLSEGSRVAIVSPSGPCTTADIVELKVTAERFGLEGWETEVVGATPPSHSADGASFLAASDGVRRRSLIKALKNFDAVIFSRGGYGAARLLESTGWDTQGPWLIGFSDATALLWARYAAGLEGGVHGPVAKNLCVQPEWCTNRLVSLLKGEPLDALKLTHLAGPTSKVTAPVLAGNLAVATSLLGTPNMPATEGHMLVLEDVNEPSYKVDRMLTQWRLSGRLAGVAAIVFGVFDAIPNPETYEVLVERTEDLGMPIYSSLDIGHHGICAALTIGKPATISRNRLLQ